MIAVLIALIWAGVAVYGIEKLTTVALAFTPAAIAQQKMGAPSEEIPEDLVALALGETEVWAQEEMMRVIQERFEALKDWNRVRSAMGVGIRLEA